MKMVRNSVSAVVLWVAFGACAGLGVAPAEAHEVESSRNRISFQVEAVREVANDWATARLSVFSEGQNSAQVAENVNRAMAAALKRSKAESGIDVTTGAYVTHPVYDDGRVVRWRAQQELRLETADVDKLSELVGNLQRDGVTLSGISFSVADETRRALEDELIAEAIGRFRARAALVAESMKSSGWSLVDMNVGQGGGGRPMVHTRGEAMMMSKAAPAAFESGSSDVSVHVNGTVELE